MQIEIKTTKNRQTEMTAKITDITHQTIKTRISKIIDNLVRIRASLELLHMEIKIKTINNLQTEMTAKAIDLIKQRIRDRIRTRDQVNSKT